MGEQQITLTIVGWVNFSGRRGGGVQGSVGRVYMYICPGTYVFTGGKHHSSG